MAKSNPEKTTKPLIPPDEAMWQKYSPHFELPLASATSVFLHGLGIGLLAMGGLAFFFTSSVEATKPPRMDVVMIEGNGTGFEGEGGEPGSPGSPDAGGKTEQVTPTPEQPDSSPMPPRVAKDAPQLLEVPMIDDGLPPVSGELAIEIANITKEAEERVKRSMKIDTPPTASGPAKKPGQVGTGNPKGVGGKGGTGMGTGVGNKKGPGVGVGGLAGRKGTLQEIYAQRWRFDMSGDAREHARKLAATGVIVAIPDPNPAGGFFVITDLNRRPVDLKKDGLVQFKDAVKWFNTRPESVDSLARELQLPFVPKFVVLLLPKDREQRMAEEEAQFAKAQRRDMNAVQETWFDFRLLNGAYEPHVTRQK